MKKTLLVSTLLLTLACGAWAEDEVTLAMEDADNSPYSYAHKDGTFSGFHYELINQAAKAAGFSVHWLALPWNRALKSLETGVVHGVIYISPNEERRRYATFDEGNFLHFEEVCMFTRAETASTLHWDGQISNLPHLKYGFNTNYLVSTELEKAKPSLDFTQITGNTTNLIEMMLKKRIDAFFSARPSAEENPVFKANKGKLVAVEPCQQGDNRYVAFSKANKDADAWSHRTRDALAVFRKTDDYKALLKKYSFEFLLKRADSGKDKKK